ncbi:hypothetical protein [Nannocystis radixulma]|uniref:Lipoprotein n=1 Tax=Nannocystis radixulma TaxID=2995305 RepID=A0ABT5BDF7_9BACT|nr:hypothetical protein [Nannocystis radixulma]MDC0671549.1 hypothetical protein [Nannocystis radixulma]
MSRVVLSFALALAWAPLAGCAVSASAGTGSGSMSSGTGPQGKPARRVDEGGAGASEGGAGAAPAGPPPCQPALADTPTALFGTRILVRMPKGVELAEQNPFYAQAVAPDQATSCGQPLAYAAVGFFEYPNAPTTAVRDQVLELRGIAKGTATWEDEGTRGKTYTGAYSAPADAATGAPAVRGWFVLRDANDKYGYFALYETDPTHWDALKSVLVASGKSLLVKPRSVASPVEGQVSAAPPAGGATGAGASGGLAAEPAGAKPAKPAKGAKAVQAK